MHILIIGTGGMGLRHIKAFSSLREVKINCFDIDVPRLEKIKNQFKKVDVVGSLDIAREEKIKGVVIASPSQTHIGYMEWCVQNHLPFLVEKPISVTPEGIPELINKVAGDNLVSGVAYPRRYSQAVQKMKQLLAEGFIGNLRMVNSVFSQDFRKYRPDYQKTYYSRLASGGGLLMDALSHHVDLATYFAGKVKSVTAISERLEFEGCEGEDTAIMALKFENGVIGNIQGNQFQKPNIDTLELVGTKGNMRYDRLASLLSWNHSDDLSWQQESISGDWEYIIQLQAENFIDAIQAGGRHPFLRTSLSEAAHTLNVILASRESNNTRQAINVGTI